MQPSTMEAREAQETRNAREGARQLLGAFRAAQPAWKDDVTPLDELAGWLDLAIETFNPDDQPPGTYGYLEPRENLIWLGRDLPPTLRRFTLAHEMGHALLHRQLDQRVQALLQNASFTPVALSQQSSPEVSPEDPCQADDVREELSGPPMQATMEEALGPGMNYDPRSQRELIANIFAAELLMPLERLRDLYLMRAIEPTRLAEHFGVSPAALLNRLAEVVLGDAEDDTDEQEEEISSESRAAHPEPRPEKRFDAYQQRAIEAPTPALIVAGPGSGKTSTLIGRTEYLINRLHVPPQHILALTFSRKAAREMQERLQATLPEGSAIPSVSTFHAFCADLLRTHGELVGLRQGFALVDDAEGYFLLRRLGARLPLHHYQNLVNPPANFPHILSAISRAKDELVAPDQYRQLAQHMLDSARNAGDEQEQERAERALEVAEIYALYQQRLEQQGDTDFGGLVMLAVQLLQEHPEVCDEVCQQYQHILVDEFQDINRASGVLLRLLAGDEQRVWVVGDANQAIYGFRGASPANITNFRQDYPGAVILPLSRNYRSRPDIVHLAEAFRHACLEPDSAMGAVESARPAQKGVAIILANAPDDLSELQGIVEDIRYRHFQGYAYRDMVVLCRTRALARKVTRELLVADLPVTERGGMLMQEHIRGLLSVLMLLTDSGSMGILRAAREWEHPFTQEDIEALLLALREGQADEHSEQGEQKDRRHAPHTLKQLLVDGHAPPALSREGRRSFLRLSAIVKTLLFTPGLNSIWLLLAHYLLIETSIGRDILALREEGQEDSARVDYADLLALARFYDSQQATLRLQEAEQRGEDNPEIPKMPQMPQMPQIPPVTEQVRGFLDYIRVLLALRQDGGSRREAEEESGETPPDILRVMTVHASKGLEFPVVYLPGLSNRRFPAQKRAQPAPPPYGMIAGESKDNEKDMHESGEACLFYVGATRAREHLVLSYADRYGKQPSKRSSYIDALLAGLPVERVTRVAWPKIDFEDDGDEEEDDQDAMVISQPGEAFIAASKPSPLHVSDIETYQRCPRQFLYGSIYRFRGETAAYQLFRRATQHTLDDLQKRIEESRQDSERYPTEEDAHAFYSQRWQEVEGHTTPFGPLYEQHGREVAELLRRKLLELGGTNWQLSPTYTIEVNGTPIAVSIDRVESSGRANDAVRFVKTGYGRRKDKVEPTTRELLYTRAHRQHHPNQPIELQFHNMSTGATFEIKLTQKKEQKLYEELQRVLAALERDEFPPKPDPFVCPGCAFFLICPA